MELPIYLDNHATTAVDPRVVEAMLPCFSKTFGNPSSTNHRFGWDARDLVDEARKSIAAGIGAAAKEIVFTSGATESNNLALRGAAESQRRRGDHLISVVTEHPSVLEALDGLKHRGYDVTLLPVIQSPDPRAGRILPEQVAEAIRDDTLLVSVMLANNEIGVIQPLEEIGRICRQRDVLLHSDATQAVGKIPVDVDKLGIDLMSFSAHKMYGPKGVGVLYARRRPRPVPIQPLVYGGRHEGGLRSGTLNVPGIVGLARTLELCLEEMEHQAKRLYDLRTRLHDGLTSGLSGIQINGPALSPVEWRLPGNLNLRFAGVEGESLLISTKDVAASSGSACTTSKPEASHVLRALGLGDDVARCSVRFGLGRYNTTEQIDFAVAALIESVTRLRKMSSLPMIWPED